MMLEGTLSDGNASNHSFSSSSSDNGTADKRRNILRFSSNLQTWASEYPFPNFRPSRKHRKHRSGPGGHNKVESDSESDDVYKDDESDEKPDSSSEDEAERHVRILAPHPHASDAILEHHRTSWASHAASFGMYDTTDRPQVSTTHQSDKAPPSGTPPAGREEVSTLIALAHKFSNSPLGVARTLSSRIDATHMDVKWLADIRPQPPSCHLHLGNLHLRLDEKLVEKTVLINSPRSALVLFRKGVPLSSLLRRPWAQKRFTHKASFGALDTLTLTERREYVLEELRRRRLEEALRDYEALCAVTAVDDIVCLAADIMRDRHKLSTIKQVRPLSSVSRALHASVSTQVTEIAGSRPNTALSSLKRRLEQARSVSEQSVMESPLMVRARLLRHRADETTRKIKAREAATAELLNEQEAQRKERIVLLHGRNHLVREQQRTATSAQAYRNIVLDRHNARREDMASRYREAMYTCSMELSEAQRQAHIVRDRLQGTNSRNHNSTIR